jgi:hypothetical protein
MSIIIEDGSGKADSEAYVSVADATSYHALRGNASWAVLTEAQCEQALRKATDYMTQVYRLRWDGSRVNGVQALDFPRAFVKMPDYFYSNLDGFTGISGNYYFPNDEVPQEVKNACAELALKSISGELAPDLERSVVKEKIDVIEIEYDKNAVQYTRYRAIDNMLAPFLNGGSSGTFRKVVRV